MSTLEFNDDAAADEETKRRALEEVPQPVRTTEQATGNSSRWTDARYMRETFGIPRWDGDRKYEGVIPNCFEHSWEAGGDRIAGGTDFLARGKPGSGKSTLGCYSTIRLLEINDEKVVWRGSSSRSEWLPLAPWTVLCLPEGVDVSARLESKDPTDPAVLLDVDDLEQIVRSVERYSDPVDLNRRILKPGQFHVVYPDPRLRGCQEIYELDDEKRYDTPPKRDTLFSSEDPATHWWFAWALARVNHGPHHWTTWICDEIGDLAPQSASKDNFGTLQKVELLKDTWVDARKFGLSIFLFAHSEVDIHQLIRHKIRWRIQMPGMANPTSSSDLIGFESVRMDSDMTSRMDVGEALMYNETNFDRFSWDDIPDPTSYKLKIEVGSR
jgi:hypothetical protein